MDAEGSDIENKANLTYLIYVLTNSDKVVKILIFKESILGYFSIVVLVVKVNFQGNKRSETNKVFKLNVLKKS